MRKYVFGSVAALALIVAAACSGGTNAPSVPYPVASGIGSGSLSSASATVISIPASTGLGTGSVGLIGSGSVAATQSSTNPSSTKAVQAKTLKGANVSAQAAGNTPLAYITLTATSSSTISQIATLSVAPTSTIPSGSYYLAFWNGSQWVTIGSEGKLISGVITFTGASLTPEVTLAAGQNYYLAVYTGSIFTTPTPPPPAPVASPATLTVSLGTVGAIQITSGVGITITASSDNASVVKPDTATASTGAGTTATFQIDPIAVGTAHLTFTDPLGHSTVVPVTVNNTFPSPDPSPASGAVISLGSTPTIQVKTKIGHVIRAVSSDTTVLTVPSQTTAGSDSFAHITVTAVAPGQATITFTDEVNDQSTFAATVSNIKNGSFNNGMTDWSNCSYAHVPLLATVNEATPKPVNPVATQSPAAASTPVPSALLAGLSMVATPPPNDNPSPPPGVGPTAPPELGSTVALVGSLDESAHNQPRGEFGVCQNITVSAKTPNLWFWVWEGGSNFNFKTADQNVAILDQSGNLQATLLAEQHCYIHPGVIGSPGQAANAFTSAATSGCWPSVFGGDRNFAAGAPFNDWIGGGFWSLRGPFDLSNYIGGGPITLYFGNFSNSASSSANFSSFMFLGNVEMLPATMATPPPVAPLAARHSLILELRHH